jgi:hypothetical protein
MLSSCLAGAAFVAVVHCSLVVSTSGLATTGNAADSGSVSGCVGDACAPAPGPSSACTPACSPAMGAVCTTDRKCVAPRACSELVALSPRPPSGVFRVDPGGGADGGAGAFDAYCELDSNENGGGWTLLLKMDGASTRLEYASPLWTNADTYNADKPQLDVVEAKLAGFSTMPVSSIRIGMLDLGTRRWIVAPVSAPSLQALFSGPYVATSLGRAAWRSLVASPSTQKNCNV